MYCIPVTDFTHWRKSARELLKRRILPDHITWQTGKQSALLFDEGEDFLAKEVVCPTPSITRDFFSLAQNVASYRDDSRWSLLYSIAWRLVFEDRDLLNFKVDKQVSQFLSMNKAVSRDRHKMKAFVRFRKVDVPVDASINQPIDGTDSSNKKSARPSEEYFVSWFEPEHLIVPLVTPFFVKRFNTMRWSILTPDVCVHWDLQEFTFTEGAARSPQVEDRLEDMWREYYANIFNPARLKLKAMQSEMPKKYWANLPEARLISELTRSAGSRTDTMINEGESSPWHKTEKSRFVKAKQQQLRASREKRTLH